MLTVALGEKLLTRVAVAEVRPRPVAVRATASGLEYQFALANGQGAAVFELSARRPGLFHFPVFLMGRPLALTILTLP